MVLRDASGTAVKQPGSMGMLFVRMWAVGAIMCIMFVPLCHARTWHVPSEVPTIQAGVDSAMAGDDVLVEPGEYFEHDLDLKGGLWIHSDGGAAVTVVNAEGQGRGFYGSDLGELVIIEGFTIRDGRSTGYGGGVGVWQSPCTIRNCVIENCYAAIGGGIYARGASSAVSGCVVRDCTAEMEGGGIGLHVFGEAEISECYVVNNVSYAEGGGIAAGGYEATLTVSGCVVSGNRASDGLGGGISCLGSELLVRDCLVIHNTTYGWWGGGGISASASSGHGLIEGCTICHNVGHIADGLDVRGAMEIRNTVSCFNQGKGVRCHDYSDISLSCCDLYGNTDGDGLCGADLGGNFSYDPLFCDPENDDYTVEGSSPCLPGNHPDGVDCGLIGARGVGCGAIPVEMTTWGQIKAGFR